MVSRTEGQLGARSQGKSSQRWFDPDNAGGPIEELDWREARIHEEGVKRAIEHLSRFPPDRANQAMVDRLQRILNGEMKPTSHDLRFYTHELREYERYRIMGWQRGQPLGRRARVLWNNCHTAAMEDYGIKSAEQELYHPEAWVYIEGEGGRE